MDTSQPPLICDQCGQPISSTESLRAVQRIDKATNEPAKPERFVHEGCWDEWAKAHGTTSS
jgi:hypothetical protein